MKWGPIKRLQPEAFRRTTGMKPPVFDKMVEILSDIKLLLTDIEIAENDLALGLI